ncbi:MAG: phosphodiester glycosidase family protein [Armatimonadaceae bacterium]
MDHLPWVAGIATLGLLANTGCRRSRPEQHTRRAIRSDLTFVDDPASRIQLLDLRVAGSLRARVVARNVTRIGANHIGDALTVAEWVEETGAVAGINGGFFGDTVDAAGRRRQIVQLAVVDGEVVAPGGAVEARLDSGRRERYLRSAVGFTRDGSPRIEWSAGTHRLGPRRADRPVYPYRVRPWDIDSAVACGPRLIHRGIESITDAEERLRHVETAQRTFVAYDAVQGRPSRLVLGCGDSLRYQDIAKYLNRYFRDVHRSQVAEAMCLDGGASSQLVYRTPSGIMDARPTGVFVPTAILLFDR